MTKIAPSILTADFARLGEEFAKVEKAADFIHWDVMDGSFVPNITFGPSLVASLRPASKLPFIAHLMVSHPGKHIKAFVEAGCEYVTVHAEATDHLHRLLYQIKELGAKAGAALNPTTPLTAVEEVIKDLDLLLLMSVNPGWGGQKFIPQIMNKIKRARKLLDESGSGAELEVDGGVKADNCRAVAAAGATILVAGSAVFGQKDPAGEIAKIRRNLSGL